MYILSQSIKTNAKVNSLVLTEVTGESLKDISHAVARRVNEYSVIKIEHGTETITEADLFGAARTGEIRLTMKVGSYHTKNHKNLIFKYVGRDGNYEALPTMANSLKVALEWAQWACRDDAIDRVDVYSGVSRVASAVHHYYGDDNAVTVSLF